MLGSVAAVLVVALVVVLGVRYLRPAATTPWAAPSAATTATGVSYGGYLWTDPLLDLPRDHSFDIEIDFDPQVLADERGMSLREFGDHAFSVYTEPGLSRLAGSEKRFSGKTATVFGNDPLEGAAAINDDFLEGDADLLTQVRDGAEDDSWGLHDEYYLVQRIDREGRDLAEPIVTRFTVQHDLAAPEVVYSSDASGNLALSWKPVDGATGYIVVKTEVSDVVDPDATCRAVTVIGQTDETTWSAADSVAWADEGAGTVEYQNVGFELYLVAAEDAEQNSDLAAYTGSAFEYGVIATDGSEYSPYVSQDAVSVSSALPAALSLSPFGDANSLTAFYDLATAPTAFGYTALDGTLRQTVLQLDPATIVASSVPGFFTVVARAPGSLLGEIVSIEPGDQDPADAVAAFNARALGEAPPTGLTDLQETESEDDGGGTPDPTPSPEESEDPTPAPTPEESPTPTPEESESPTPEESESPTPEETPAPPPDLTPQDDYVPPGAPDLGYPVYGSNDFVRYIAAHMIAGAEEIDISDYFRQPGAQTIEDAVAEAMAQNQYVIGAYSYAYQYSGSSAYVWVYYYYDPATIAAIQAEVQAKVGGVLGSIITDGMSEADKVTAINDYLVKTGEYDMIAYEDAVAGGNYANYWYAQDVDGILIHGLGVCSSYARSFDILADAAGLDSVLVTGDVYSGGRHAWNKVMVDGVWKAMDVTWNDAGSTSTDEFLMINDSQFTGDSARMEDSYWMNDLLIGAYATP